MTLYMTTLPSMLGRFLIVLARVGRVIHAQNMVQCAAFDLDATIKAAIRVWKGVVEYSPRPWMPATWFSATVASADWHCYRRAQASIDVYRQTTKVRP